ncbi:extracellular solute-binding protein [Paenibacillus sp. CF384]|uniref:extracellular solute-binding protein n=1 Tax=Paenibacillus sp. CF384 TaxID=1884382 RepID=UPI000897D460|nr:extracellular solute-binding protein [Paenibacillus sp. CF384]SDW71477.1 carbohydrate ABC transporter substrate-binding protein, CUT1 family [Paenibacillus sp. CF384]
MPKKLLLFVTATILVLSSAACSQDNSDSTETPSNSTGSSEEVDTAVLDPYTPYKETVSFTKGVIKGSENFPEGDSFSNNDYTRYVKEQMNIETKIAWEVDRNNYDQKIALSIASQEIPDMMVVDRKTFKQLIDNDLIWDMTDIYEKTISPFLRKQYDSYGERLFKEVTVDGKLMGIPATNIGYCQNVLWIRKDWLEKLNLEVPKTLDEVLNVAKQFIEKDPGGNGAGKTVGLTTVDTVFSGYNSRFGLDTIFSVFGAYPGSWVNQDGKPVYGSVMSEMKPALTLMRDLYKQGILDKEFAIRKGEDREALLASGQLGMYFGVWWPAGGQTAAVTNNPDADWIAVSAPINEDGKLTTVENDPLAGIVVVSKKFKHPEAIVKALNAGYDSLRGNGEAGAASYEHWNKNSPGMGWGTMPIPIAIDYNNAIEVLLDDLNRALEADDPSLITLKGFTGTFDRIKANRANPKADINMYLEEQARIVGTAAAVDENLELVPAAFFGQTDTMTTKWSNLRKLETEMMIQTIMGERSIEDFDKFVTQWYAIGGQEITNEIAAQMNP